MEIEKTRRRQAAIFQGLRRRDSRSWTSQRKNPLS